MPERPMFCVRPGPDYKSEAETRQTSSSVYPDEKVLLIAGGSFTKPMRRLGK